MCVPQRRLRILPGSGFYAGVNGDTLFVTEGMRCCLWTRVGEGVLAHEMAHLSRRHVIITSVAIVTVAYLVAPILEMLGDSSWPVAACVLVTLTSVVIPPLLRRQEYDADSKAARAVGTETMVHTLRVMGEGELGNL